MMKLKRLTAFLLALSLLLLCPVFAAAEGFVYNWDQDTDDNPYGPHCESMLLLNLDTDTVVYAMEPDVQRPMASMTKIMSYIVAYETIPDIENTIITVPESVALELEGTYSSEATMYTGERFTGRDMLYMMMVPSGNNAALTLDKYVNSLYEDGTLTWEGDPLPPATPLPDDSDEDWEGPVNDSGIDPTDYTGISYFVELMNRKAQQLGCKDTHFTNSHGLHNKNHYSTARDMATITKYAMTVPGFTEVTGTTAWEYSPVGQPEVERIAYTTNKLLVNNVDDSGVAYYYQSATGIKTGSLDESGYCITASATAFGYTYIAVGMGAPMYDQYGNQMIHGEMLDVRSLFRWAVGSLEKKTVAVQGDVLSSIDLKYAWRKDSLQLTAAQNVAVMLPTSVDENSILVVPDIPDSVEAPIRKGEQIGTATISYAGDLLATVPLVAGESVAKSEVLEVWEQGQQVLTSPWFLVIMAVIVALIIVYIILIVLYRRKQRQLRKVKRFREI